MRLLPRPFRRVDREPDDQAATGPLDPAPRRVPDPGKPAQARGSWEQAAFTNVQITELIKRELNAETPPWKK